MANGHTMAEKRVLSRLQNQHAFWTQKNRLKVTKKKDILIYKIDMQIIFLFLLIIDWGGFRSKL